MSAFNGYLALGTLDPVSGAFTEAGYAGYARQPIALDLDLPANGGAVQTGGTVLRNNAALSFPAPGGLDWPLLNAYALFSVPAGGNAQVLSSLMGHGGVHQRGVARSFRAGFFVLELQPFAVTCRLGGIVVTIGEAVIVAGQLVFVSSGSSGASGGTSGGTSPASGGTLDFSDPNNSALLGAI